MAAAAIATIYAGVAERVDVLRQINRYNPYANEEISDDKMSGNLTLTIVSSRDSFEEELRLKAGSLEVHVPVVLHPEPDRLCIDKVWLIGPKLFYHLNLPPGTNSWTVKCYELSSPTRYSFRITDGRESWEGSTTDPAELHQLPLPSSSLLVTATREITAKTYGLQLNNLNSPQLSRSETFWYPFDRLNAEFSIVMEYRLLKNQQTVDSRLTALGLTSALSHDREWEAYLLGYTTVFNEPIWDADKLPSNTISELPTASAYLIRPALNRIVFPIVLISIFILICLITLTSDLSIFVGGATAILVALFGLRQVLLPSWLETQTLFDVLILSLYIAFGIATGVFLLKKTAALATPLVPRLRSFKSRYRLGKGNSTKEVGHSSDPNESTG